MTVAPDQREALRLIADSANGCTVPAMSAAGYAMECFTSSCAMGWRPRTAKAECSRGRRSSACVSATPGGVRSLNERSPASEEAGQLLSLGVRAVAHLEESPRREGNDEGAIIVSDD
jgi:hypothetical protein